MIARRYITSFALPLACGLSLIAPPLGTAQELPSTEEMNAGEAAEVAGPTASPTPLFTPLAADIEKQLTISLPVSLPGRIAFSVFIEEQWRILMLDLDARKVRRLVEGPGNSWYPAWSPDGKSFAFSSDRDGNREIYLADWEGRGVRRLTTTNMDNDAPAWSPDGSQITFHQSPHQSPGTNGRANAKTPNSTIAIVDVTSGKIRTVVREPGHNVVPRWGPGLAAITYSTDRFWPGWDVCQIDLTSDKESCILAGTTSFCRADWSRDYSKLVYSEGSLDQINLALFTPGKKSKETLTKLDGREYDGVFSPDGKLIAFVAENTKRDIFNLFTVDGAKQSTLILRSPFSIRYLSWTPVKTIDLESERILEQEAALLNALATPTSGPLLPSPPTENGPS